MINVADLFCGAGGTSTGAMEALSGLGLTPNLTAINHWDRAIETHAANHPEAVHMCVNLMAVSPRELYQGKKLDLLWASPECTNHSLARGSKKVNDQSRSMAMQVVDWAQALLPELILVENVKEFRHWGPLDENGRPIKAKKGEIFASWLSMLRALGYTVEWRLLNAADYGDPQTRVRIIIQAVRGQRKIVWPEPTHVAPDKRVENDRRLPWRTARNSVIDWSLPSQSIFERKKPLAANTIRRILLGLRRQLETKIGEPFILHMEHGGRLLSVDNPINTITTAKGGAHALVEPMLIELRGTSDAQIAQSAKSVDGPVPTVATSGAHHMLLEPMLIPQHSAGILRPVSHPTSTVTTTGAIALVEPFMVEYYGAGRPIPVDKPLGTATAKQRFGLVTPAVVQIDGRRYSVDLRYRMLQPHELAAAQGFRKDYQFRGTKTEVTKQIGNAVPRRLARAVVMAAWSQDPKAAHRLALQEAS